ncbi:CDP-diacylglycerol--glycerol-3-phosphate 3-phosphatidyltransferase [Alkaliphilus sp. MSJ-5]|uniref:CDP-diacylglycerol--glycerol-3-phosphate 3-phosphatidyltransferase n=1 Tax=Alkaliphilus flagellatus TaxID=2841507 RepID=A0ABS6G607_9FIRM|nr:CDP-diacylglycerol--glycerol-3-phosphate 3-phosphatidyltransferase [Alkaliphilus flagellatus]MBU5677053.1 CDP-diacylglycerol--glycerol-3-phosphate 3-phosphatidyltransferase [Alkaliphilus flagellatus]
MNLPNILTTVRFVLIPLFVGVFFSPLEKSLLYSVIIFILAGITDVLDGYIARKYDAISKWGQAMDPLADKLMQLTVLICFTSKQFIPIWVISIYGIKEISMILGGIVLYTKKDKLVVPANSYGKIATIVFYIAILAIAFDFIYGKALIIIAALLTLYAFVRYALLGIQEIKKPPISGTPE